MELLLTVAAVLAAAQVYLAVHEGAHALSAALLGVRPSTVRIGVGPVLLRLAPSVEVRAFPLGGWVSFGDDLLLDRRTRVVLAGSAIAAPAATLAVSALLAVLSPEAQHALVTAAPFGPGAASTFVRSLTVMCTLLGAADLFPLPPLDGGTAALLLSGAGPETIRTARAAGAAVLTVAAAWFLGSVAGITG